MFLLLLLGFGVVVVASKGGLSGSTSTPPGSTPGVAPPATAPATSTSVQSKRAKFMYSGYGALSSVDTGTTGGLAPQYSVSPDGTKTVSADQLGTRDGGIIAGAGPTQPLPAQTPATPNLGGQGTNLSGGGALAEAGAAEKQAVLAARAALGVVKTALTLAEAFGGGDQAQIDKARAGVAEAEKVLKLAEAAYDTVVGIVGAAAKL
jgi:hypothetical protein